MDGVAVGLVELFTEITRPNSALSLRRQNTDCICIYITGDYVKFPHTTCHGILMRVVCMHGLYKKEWKLLALQNTQVKKSVSATCCGRKNV